MWCIPKNCSNATVNCIMNRNDRTKLHCHLKTGGLLCVSHTEPLEL
jgi:hypothetical protein